MDRFFVNIRPFVKCYMLLSLFGLSSRQTRATMQSFWRYVFFFQNRMPLALPKYSHLLSEIKCSDQIAFCCCFSFLIIRIFFIWVKSVSKMVNKTYESTRCMWFVAYIYPLAIEKIIIYMLGLALKNILMKFHLNEPNSMFTERNPNHMKKA